jgi:hypothetical protein
MLRSEMLVNISNKDKKLANLLKQVAEAEREICAQIAQSFDSRLWTQDQRHVALLIESQIRARGE